MQYRRALMLFEKGEWLGDICRLFVVDGHPVFRMGVRALLGARPSFAIVGEAGDVRSARDGIQGLRPDLVLMDLVLDGGSGIDLLGWIRAELPTTRALVMSMLDEVLYAERCLRLGASGYLHKGEPAHRLVEAVDTVLLGDVFLGAGAASRLMRRVAGGVVGMPDPVRELSNRELEVFQLIGQGHRPNDIADMLCISPKTVESHQAKLRRKLGARNSVELIRLAATWSEHQGRLA